MIFSIEKQLEENILFDESEISSLPFKSYLDLNTERGIFYNIYRSGPNFDKVMQKLGICFFEVDILLNKKK